MAIIQGRPPGDVIILLLLLIFRASPATPKRLPYHDGPVGATVPQKSGEGEAVIIDYIIAES